MSFTGEKNITYDNEKNTYCVEFYNADGSRICRFRFKDLKDAIEARDVIAMYGVEYYKHFKSTYLQN